MPWRIELGVVPRHGFGRPTVTSVIEAACLTVECRTVNGNACDAQRQLTAPGISLSMPLLELPQTKPKPGMGQPLAALAAPLPRPGGILSQDSLDPCLFPVVDTRRPKRPSSKPTEQTDCFFRAGKGVQKAKMGGATTQFIDHYWCRVK